jgi:hypothetical protein
LDERNRSGLVIHIPESSCDPARSRVLFDFVPGLGNGIIAFLKVRQQNGRNCLREIDICLVDKRTNQRLIASLVCALSEPWSIPWTANPRILKRTSLACLFVRFNSGSREGLPLPPRGPIRARKALNPNTCKLRTASICQSKAIVPGAPASDPLFPRKLAKMPRRAYDLLSHKTRTDSLARVIPV